MQYGRMATLVLIVGLPGAGKTTQAKELAAQHHTIRLTLDEWVIPLFGLRWREPLARGKRDVLEGRLISTALQVLRLETSVVLDFGSWAVMNGHRYAGWPDQPEHYARWSTSPWTGTSSLPRSRVVSYPHRTRPT
jgi:hypothetical protein